jgi:hypothetical protein
MNKTYNDWDSIVLQLNQGESGLLNIRIMRQDLESLVANHNASRADVLEMMIQALEEECLAKAENSSTDAVS